ncbi:MAG: NAD(P)/FAD-dependent oxidoreductase [Methanoregula sp.]|jgi:geranylgeranyl reductase family protein|nr:NAD(P)/FAD-dependent oxidoreductase [Methanoregula sp.]
MVYDVIVIGAGPAGSAAASECAKSGLSTLCIEEHGTIGYPVQCAGLLSNAAFAECRVSDRPVLTRVSGARVVSGTGNEILIDAKIQKAVVVDRGSLDREMAESAANAGTEFLLKTAAYGIRGTTLITRGAKGHEEIPFRLLIAADGPRSTIARMYGMPRAKTYLAGIQADMLHDCDPRFVELYPDASPDFFGWMIPTGKGRVRIGLCGQSNVPERFKALIKKFGTQVSHLVTGALPLGLMPRTYGHRTLFVGDAAGFAKPTSGGGVYTGIRSARHAAAIASVCCETDIFTDSALAAYEQRWQADIGRDLDLGFRIFQMRQKISAEDMDALIRLLNDPGIVSTIVEYGDMDRPGDLVKKLLLKPAFLKRAAPLIRLGLQSLF